MQRLRYLLASVFFLGTAVSVTAAERPNVVMIVADDQGWMDFSFMGSKIVETPHLDKLAAESAVFPNGYVPTSLCRASLATLLTGLYGHQHKICCNDPPKGVDRAAMHPFIRQAPTIPRLLNGAGYRSFQTGKFWEGHYRNGGFTEGMTITGREGGEGLVIGRQTMKPIYDFIEADRDKPFFIWYAPQMPHEPHNPPERILKKYNAKVQSVELARYYGMCEWLDETCGELLDYLDKNGLRDNTLVFFVVDNGWIQETGSGKTIYGHCAPRSKNTPYDGGVRTPILFRWPGHTKPGRYDTLVSTIDFAPTILTACGVKPPDDMPGLSLLEVSAGKDHFDRDAVFGEIYVHTAVDLHKPALNVTHRWVREGNWKLIQPVDKKSPAELYDLAKDPEEKHDLAGRHQQKVKELEQRLDQWWHLWGTES
jgi:uncharacterized sulfatase